MNATDDWYAVSELGAKTRRITELEVYGTFLIEGRDAALLVDTGIGIGDLRGLVTDLVDTPVRVLLTHSHWDHLGNCHQFNDVSIHERECSESGTVSIDVLSDEFVHRPREKIEELQRDGVDLPTEFDPAEFGPSPPTRVTPIEGGHSVDLGDRTLETVPVPGHSPGQLAILDPESRILFGADVVHKNRNLYLHFEDSDLSAYHDSFERVRDLHDSGAFETLATSHNEPLSGDELDLIDDLLDTLDDISRDALAYETVETSWGDARKYVVGESMILTKPELS